MILKPFIWMFETENFIKRIIQLLLMLILFYSLAYIFNITAKSEQFDTIFKLIFYILSVIAYACSWLISQGYFWELTSNIISRDVDISANSIYSGKVKNIFKIDLPEFRPGVFLWRGIASVVASIIMIFPYAMLVYSTILTESFSMPWDNIDSYHKLYAMSYNILYFIFFITIPAMLWNYAKQNSIIAVWNVPKAVYIIENYFMKYVLNTIVFVAFYILNCFILYSIYNIWGSNVTVLAAPVIYLYTLHVYAYLIGTITPVAEG